MGGCLRIFLLMLLENAHSSRYSDVREGKNLSLYVAVQCPAESSTAQFLWYFYGVRIHGTRKITINHVNSESLDSGTSISILSPM